MTYKELKALDDDYEVCHCMGVTLGEILKAIEEGNDTLEALMEATDAGTACELCQSKEIDEDEDREVHLDEILEFVKNNDA
ncbi:MAG TPA: (2Fe-2S)-binding protein [Campylobacterales bacterium]|nr:(2Fe-2S)-binding protein [Campylobacterales bacterium]